MLRKFIILCVSFLLWGCVVVGAQEVSFTAQVNTNKISLGSFVELVLTVHGAQNVPEMSLDQLKGFEVQYMGPSSRVTIINGQYTKSKSFVYRLFPSQTGRFGIPPLKLTMQGQAYTTEPIVIEVVDSAQAGQQTVTLEDKLFVVLKILKNQVVVNEAVPVQVLLFVTDFPMQYSMPTLEGAGFQAEEFNTPRQYNQTINGLVYAVREFNTVIYPTRTGTLIVGPVSLEGDITIQGESPHTRGLFSSFFDRGQRRRLVLTAPEKQLQVGDIPKEGRPENFSGGVGQYNFNVSYAPTAVQVGDPVTLNMVIEGQGNLRVVDFPSLDFGQDFKVYAPIVTEENGQKIMEQVIIPTHPEVKEIPAIHFTYFNPQTNTYEHQMQGPFPLEVSSLAGDDSFKVIGREDVVAPVMISPLGKDITFIKDRMGVLRPKGFRWYHQIGFYGVMFFFILVYGVLYGRYWQSHRLAHDEGYARRFYAPRYARHGLVQAQKMLAADQSRAFYDILFKTLEKYLGNKYQLASGQVTLEHIAPRLSSTEGQRKVFQNIQGLFRQCEQVRYASGNKDQKEMGKSYLCLKEIIDDLERGKV